MFDTLLIVSLPIIAIFRLILSKYHSFYLYLIGLVYVYAAAPLVLYLTENPFYLRFCMQFCLFKLDDLRFGFLLVTSTLLPLLMVEFIVYRKPLWTGRPITNINKLNSSRNLYYFYYVIYSVNLVGIYLYGISDFFSSYTDPESNKIGSVAWSIMTNSFYLLAVLYGNIGSKSKVINYSFLFLLCFYLMGGARLVPVMSLLYLLALWYGPTFKMTSKLFLTAIIFCVLFVLIGAFRSAHDGSLILANGFLEFGFVPIGYYNAIAKLDLIQLNLFEFFVNTFRVIPGSPFNGSEDINLVMELYGTHKLYSPIGGSFVISSLLIYFGLFAYPIFFTLITLLMLADWNSCVKYSRDPSIKNQIIKSFFVFIAVFALINLTRNNYYSFVSISVKSLVIHLFLSINFKIIRLKR